MILRQFIIRHGRTVISASTRQAQRAYATQINLDSPVHKPSNQDFKAYQSIPGHLDEASSLIDAVGHGSTPATESLESQVHQAEQEVHGLQGQINAMLAAQNGGAIPSDQTSFTQQQQSLPPAPFESIEAMQEFIQAKRQLEGKGSAMTDVYFPWTIVHDPPAAEEVSLETLLANQCHLGHATSLWHPGNSSYIFGIRHGIHIISLEMTLSYLRRAAKVVQEVARRGGIILFVGTRKQQHEIVVKSAERAKGYHIFSRWIPGSLTNGQQILENCAIKVVDAKDEELTKYRDALSSSSHAVLRPDLVICLNALENEVCLHECGLYNVPTIGIVDTDVNPAWVTYPIPANDDSLRSVALISGVLSRAASRGQELRSQEAERGRTTYSTKKVQQFLQGVEEIAGMDVQEKGQGDRGRKDD